MTWSLTLTLLVCAKRLIKIISAIIETFQRMISTTNQDLIIKLNIVNNSYASICKFIAIWIFECYT